MHCLFTKEGHMQNPLKINFFDQKFEQEKNQHVVDLILASDSNIEKPHLIDFFFYGSKDNLKSFAQELEKENFNIDHLNDSSLIVSKECMIDTDELTEVTLFLQDTAQKYNVEYDGWGTGIVG